MPPPILKRIDLDSACRQLATADPRLGRMIARIGPCRLEPRYGERPHDALFRAIIYQQLSGKAARTIYTRVLAIFDGTTTPTPAEVLAAPEAALRAAGLSRNKLLALRDLAARTLDGTVPTLAQARRLEDAILIERLVAVRGVGRWTAEMLLMFGLGRPDVLPVLDLGIRKGYAVTYGRRDLPRPDTMLRRAGRWRPYRTIASWYLWRAVDTATPGAEIIT